MSHSCWAESFVLPVAWNNNLSWQLEDRAFDICGDNFYCWKGEKMPPHTIGIFLPPFGIKVANRSRAEDGIRGVGALSHFSRSEAVFTHVA